MTSVTSGPDFPGRIYSKNDLHAAAMVFIDRREVVVNELLNQFRHMSDEDIKSVVRNTEFLYSCNEAMFEQYRQRQEAA